MVSPQFLDSWRSAVAGPPAGCASPRSATIYAARRPWRYPNIEPDNALALTLAFALEHERSVGRRPRAPATNGTRLTWLHAMTEVGSVARRSGRRGQRALDGFGGIRRSAQPQLWRGA